MEDDGDVQGSFGSSRLIVDREDDYRKRRLNQTLSPERNDAFLMGDQTPDARVRTYADVMKETQLARERDNTLQNIARKEREGREAQEGKLENIEAERPTKASAPQPIAPPRRPGPAAPSTGKRTRWDSEAAAPAAQAPRNPSDWDAVEVTPQASRWDATPTHGAGAAGGWGDKADASVPRRSRWDVTPAHGTSTDVAGTKRSRWDATPASGGPMMGATPAYGAALGATPVGGFGMETPIYGTRSGGGAPGQPVPMTPEHYQAMKREREIETRNRPLSDEELNSMLPGPEEGYAILEPPPGYIPIRTPARKLTATPASLDDTPLYAIPEEDRAQAFDVPVSIEGLPDMKPEDQQYFGKLLKEVDESNLNLEEAKERKIMKLLLKVKNGTPPQRKSALRQLTDKARDFGAGPLFNQILPLLMSPTLEDQERHLLVKVIDRILFRLDELVRPYVHKILVVIEPLLIDEDYYARVEGREIIANLAKAAGLATMIAAMRPDIDNVDEYVRNTTARAFSVVASALGIPTLLPFLKAVCQSKKSWQARHTGIKIVQQIAILMGCAVLPHLKVGARGADQ